MKLVTALMFLCSLLYFAYAKTEKYENERFYGGYPDFEHLMHPYPRFTSPFMFMNPMRYMLGGIGNMIDSYSNLGLAYANMPFGAGGFYRRRGVPTSEFESGIDGEYSGVFPGVGGGFPGMGRGFSGVGGGFSGVGGFSSGGLSGGFSGGSFMGGNLGEGSDFKGKSLSFYQEYGKPGVLTTKTYEGSKPPTKKTIILNDID